ncbi:probable zinc metallo-protease [Melanopsichium pennsylvanicum]|uniref:CAAX prenyl protease n=2 Tax=Melanopsichium pennsylvanicum TaxID=63383 RepID=A0AAJ4XQJ4_9BASI|nr:probable zinc metallo-protease [Melanopsichium pennsylvanicum 4]SNX87339.1 probable zinc metallo-protease [Melanopsichium pennsylvanicum]
MLALVQDKIATLQSALDDPTVQWKKLVLALLWLVYGFETFLSLRQYRLYSLDTPPATLASHVDLSTFKKSQVYGRDKARFGFFSSAASQFISVALVYYDVYAWSWTISGNILTSFGQNDSEIPRSIVWMMIMFVLREVPSMPLTLYRNFVIEERHGFNKMTMRTFITDTIKEWLLGFVIGAPLISALLWIIRWAGNSFVSYVVVFLFSFQIIAMVLYPTVIQPLFNKLTPLPDGALRDRVVTLASSLKFPLKHIYVIDGSKRSSHSNAYFFGVIPGGNKHIVIFDTLIEKSTSDEIEAVLAHELGHYANNDPTKLLVLSQMQIGFTMSLFTLFINNVSLYRSFGFQVGPTLIEKASATSSSQLLNYLPIIIGLELFQLVLNPTDALIKFMLNSAIRRMEYAADRFAASLTRPGPTPSELAAATEFNAKEENATVKVDPHQKDEYVDLLGKALIKLHVHNLSTMHHDSLFSAYHYSHPTLAERLNALQALRPLLKKQR